MKRLIPVLSLVVAACGDVKNPNGMPDQQPAEHAVQVVPSQRVSPNPTDQPVEKAVLPADTTVAGAWLILDGSLRSHDAQTLNQLIDPEYGLWILAQRNGQPLMTRVADASKYAPLFGLDKTLMDCAAPKTVQHLPVAQCPAGKFATEGCFAGPATQFRALDFWARATVLGGTKQQGQAAQGRTVRGVLQTKTGYHYLFSKSAGVGGRWRLVFIDMRGPCQ